MKKRRKQKGQAIVEYAILLVLMAAVVIATVALAGNQLNSTYNDVSFELNHLADGQTYTPDGAAVPPGTTPTWSCPAGQSLYLRGHKWKCRAN